MKKIIIVGITGQDGSLLYQYLKSKKFNVIGLSRKKHKEKHIFKTDYSFKSLSRIINFFKPDEIYNFSGLSKPSISWKKMKETFEANLFITLNFLEIIKKKKKIKFFNTSSSEIFKDTKNKLDENSSIYPSNPYGIAKASSHFLIDAYRKKYNLFLVNGIFFNHSSFRTKNSFLLKYLAIQFKRLANNKIKKINLIDSRPVRDFGYAKDYVIYAYKLMQLRKADNFIIATGKSKSVKQIVNIYLKFYNLSYKKINYINKENSKNLNKYKIANNKKILNTLKIKKITTINQVIKKIINNET